MGLGTIGLGLGFAAMSTHNCAVLPDYQNCKAIQPVVACRVQGNGHVQIALSWRRVRLIAGAFTVCICWHIINMVWLAWLGCASKDVKSAAATTPTTIVYIHMFATHLFIFFRNHPAL